MIMQPIWNVYGVPFLLLTFGGRVTGRISGEYLRTTGHYLINNQIKNSNGGWLLKKYKLKKKKLEAKYVSFTLMLIFL